MELFTDKRICDAVFDIYDVNRDGKIDDKEWVYASSTLVAGPGSFEVSAIHSLTLSRTSDATNAD